MYKVDVYPRVRRVMMVERIGVRGSREVIGLNWDPVGKANSPLRKPLPGFLCSIYC